jgi:methyltransferase (TIGR00027 family)
LKEDKPSISAEVDAIIRDVETQKPENEKLCHDPLAIAFIGKGKRLLGKIPPLRRLALWYIEQRHPFVFDCIAARTRYIDEHVNHCIDDGIEQLIILGAGYDSRAYRMERLKEKVTVFEIDLPAIQKLKIQKLKKIIDPLPSNVVYIPIDFNSETLSQRLFQSKYDKDKKSLFIWEGVTPYLTAEAVDETLYFVANNSKSGSSIIFNYIIKSVVDGTCQLEKAAEIRKAFELEGLLFGIEEGTIESFMSERGYYQIKEISGDYYESEYFKGKNSNRKSCCLCRVVSAKVKSLE